MSYSTTLDSRKDKNQTSTIKGCQKDFFLHKYNNVQAIPFYIDVIMLRWANIAQFRLVAQHSPACYSLCPVRMVAEKIHRKPRQWGNDPVTPIFPPSRTWVSLKFFLCILCGERESERRCIFLFETCARKASRTYSLVYSPTATTMILRQRPVAKTTVITGRREYLLKKRQVVNSSSPKASQDTNRHDPDFIERLSTCAKAKLLLL
jgi:hypothetical protein